MRREPITEWHCPKCDTDYVSPLPVSAVRCGCSKRANRDYWMKPKEATK